MKKLVFVYNGDSGVINGVMHYLHKRISPETYPCQLCGIIYDGMTLNKDWLTFIKSLGVQTEYLHRDEYMSRYKNSLNAWPAVLIHEGAALKSVALSAQDFTNIPDLDTLKQKLNTIVQQEFDSFQADHSAIKPV